MISKRSISRREFLKLSALAGTELVIGVYLVGCSADETPTDAPTVVPGLEPTEEIPAWMTPSVYLSINHRGEVTVTVNRSEMGQGVRTALPMLIAEELDVPMGSVLVEQAPGDHAYGDQVTGGSQSMSRFTLVFRQAGAAARQMLVLAAAQTWGVDEAICQAQQGMVTNTDTGEQLTYGQLVATASTLDVPRARELKLKNRDEFQLIGTPVKRVDNLDILTGRAVYGSDIQLPGMLYGVVARCPVFGGAAASYDDRQALAVPGVESVIEINEGIAVVAESTWAAIKGREVLTVEWEEGGNADLNAAGLRQRMLEAVGTAAPDDTTLDVIYEVPFFAHLTIEPMNCVADVRLDSAEVWAPSQNPQEARAVARRLTGLKQDAITVHVPLIGTGFGRRLESDYVSEAVAISIAVGAPIKLIWTREDDLQHDFYHPMSVHRVTTDLAYPELPHVTSRSHTRTVPTGAWRSVDNMPDALVRECAIDEIAAALGRDPYELRLELEPANLHAVIEKAASEAGWGEPLPAGWGRGMSSFATFNATPVAMVAEVFVSAGLLQVKRMVCAIDCGMVVNPDMVAAQLEGGIAFALTALLNDTVTVENGQVQESNFHQCGVLTIDQMPDVEVHILENDNRSTGVGEMGVPPTIPAVLNAVYDAAGIRIRRLPLQPGDLE